MNDEPEAGTALYPIPTTTAPERIERRRGRQPTGEVLIKDDKTKVPCDDGTPQGWPGCKAVVQRNYLSQHRRQRHGVLVRKARKPRALPGTDVVTTVLEVVFPKGVPVRHLDAVLRWRDATVAFMKEVQDG